jgi:AraC-like DNA-binding protein
LGTSSRCIHVPCNGDWPRTACAVVIDRERRAQAERYLAEPGLHLGQIAGLLGYTEQSALNRSCRRWFGKTPRQYRADPSRRA